jgi:hypothetical protein
MPPSRRDFLICLAAAGVSAGFTSAEALGSLQETASACPFRLAVINDEISEDFDHSCQVASQEFGLKWIELRGMWGKNLTELDAKQIDDARKILDRLARSATLEAEPETRPIPRQL